MSADICIQGLFKKNEPFHTMVSFCDLYHFYFQGVETECHKEEEGAWPTKKRI